VQHTEKDHVHVVWQEGGQTFYKMVRKGDLVVEYVNNFSNCFFFNLNLTFWWIFLIVGFFFVSFASLTGGFYYYLYFYLLPNEKAKFFEDLKQYDNERLYREKPVNGRNRHYLLDIFSILNFVFDLTNRFFP
jgi:hypothetical protein